MAELFGPYRLDELLGAGGMGEVWRAYDTGRQRTVALKRLPAALANDPDYRARFRRESELSARLNEPHIIPIHDFGEIDGRLYLDMRLVEGTDLAGELARGRLDPARAVAVVRQIAAALDSAHRAGLVHRDIKPGNVLLSGADEFVYVADFGIARTSGETGQTSLTATGVTVGTVDYMAPERFETGLGDQRVDVYALGCVLYECLTGSRPFPGAGVLAQMHAHVHLPPPRPSEHGVPAGFDAVVGCAMAKNPDDRYPWAGGLAHAADAALHGRPVPTVLAARPAPEWAWGASSAGAPPVSGAPSAAVPLSAGASRSTAPPTAVPPGTRVPQAGGPWAAAPETVLAAGAAPSRDGAGAAAAIGAAGRGRGRRVGVLAAAGVVALASVTGVLLVRGGGDRSGGTPPAAASPGATATPSPTATAPPGRTGPMRLTTAATIPVGGSPCGIALSRDGSRAYVTTATEGVLSVIDTATQRVMSSIQVGAGSCQIAADPNSGGQVYIGNYQSNSVAVVDVTAGRVVSTLSLDGSPYGLAMKPTGGVLYAATFTKNALAVLIPQSGQVQGTIAVGDYPYAVAITHDGRLGYVCNLKGSSVSVIETASRTVVATIGVGGQPIAASVTPDDRHVYVINSADNTVSVIDTATNTVTATVPTDSNPKAVTASPDDRDVFVANYRAGTVWAIDTADGSVAATSPVGSLPQGVAISPDSRRVYVTNQGSNNVTVLDVTFG